MARIKKTDEEIRAEIIEAGYHLFSKYGFIKTTMEDIAKEVRKGKSTLYYYYKSKDDVFFDVSRKIADGLLSKLHEKINTLSTASEKLVSYFDVLIEEVLRVADLHALLLEEMMDKPFFDKQLSANFYFERDFEFIRDVLLLGIKRKEFMSIKESEVNRIAELIMIFNKNLITDYLLKNKIEEWKTAVKTMSELFLRGIR